MPAPKPARSLDRVPRRDPGRKARILACSAELISRHGYHAVGLADIGTAAGIVSTGIYRHFPSKSAILTALLHQVMDLLARTSAEITSTAQNDRAALTALVENHVRIAIGDRRILRVYHLEAHNLAPEDLRGLRRAQRRYLEHWVSVVVLLRSGVTGDEARVLVHAAIGSVQSILFHDSGLPLDRLTALLCQTAHACLGIAPGGA
ncbi:TetR/AcrR family transcriptional regulator [Amycolatopsis methanolica]|uniref:Transcriptional regulator, TetR family n=1 Tax=Amycolatopsis methanolica 239 TaxID=1068978 RepID=A0A076MY22_AMYME|nr:TetR/AcrR family transcriptional regulator [Amycolatopsis methanolica]AIJ25568.1 transcriptional regulator, TetR family [Amycolatopsis methanolica 239]